MRLEDYFNQQRASTVSESQKFAIYEKIINERTKGSYSKAYSRKRSLIHTKSFIYGLTLTVLFVALYGTFFMQNNIREGEDGVFIQTPNINSVNADYIANIVNFNGDFFIEHQGDRVQTSNIHNGDTIILDGDTEMVFHMDESTQARLIGPAKFVLEKNKNTYTLKLIHGDFVEIKSLQDQNTQELELLTNEFVVHQNKSSKSVNFQLINKGEKQIVANKGDTKVTVTSTQNNKTRKTSIDKSELLSIENNDISLLTVEEFNKAIQDKEVSQTFTLNNTTNTEETKQETNKTDTHDTELTAILANSGDPDIDKATAEEAAKELGINNQEDKQLLSLDNNNKLHSLLNKEFLLNDLESLFVLAQEQDNKEFNIAYNNLENRIEQIYKIFDINYNSSRGNFNTLQKNITSLHKQIKDKYLIPPKYLSNLLEINNGLGLILGGENQERSNISSQINFQ